MKALELIVYPQSGFGYKVPLRVWSPASCDPEDDFQVSVSEDDIQKRIESKRFTDAELAAEYWAPTWLTMPGADWDGDYAGTEAEMKRRMATLHRFATLPHYDEPTL